MKGQCYLFHLKMKQMNLCRFYTTLVCLYPSLEGVLARGVLCCLDPKIWIFALGRTFLHLGGQDTSLIGTFLFGTKKYSKERQILGLCQEQRVRNNILINFDFYYFLLDFFFFFHVPAINQLLLN